MMDIHLSLDVAHTYMHTCKVGTETQAFVCTAGSPSGQCPLEGRGRGTVVAQEVLRHKRPNEARRPEHHDVVGRLRLRPRRHNYVIVVLLYVVVVLYLVVVVDRVVISKDKYLLRSVHSREEKGGERK